MADRWNDAMYGYHAKMNMTRYQPKPQMHPSMQAMVSSWEQDIGGNPQEELISGFPAGGNPYEVKHNQTVDVKSFRMDPRQARWFK